MVFGFSSSSSLVNSLLFRSFQHAHNCRSVTTDPYVQCVFWKASTSDKFPVNGGDEHHSENIARHVAYTLYVYFCVILASTLDRNVKCCGIFCSSLHLANAESAMPPSLAGCNEEEEKENTKQRKQANKSLENTLTNHNQIIIINLSAIKVKLVSIGHSTTFALIHEYCPFIRCVYRFPNSLLWLIYVLSIVQPKFIVSIQIDYIQRDDWLPIDHICGKQTGETGRNRLTGMVNGDANRVYVYSV